MITIYGIKNCDTMKKTFDWFLSNNIEFKFHNYKTDSIDPKKIESWIKQSDFATVVNKKGTTYKSLSDNEKAKLESSAGINIMLKNLSILKRPIIENGKKLVIGFQPDEWEKWKK